MPESMRMKINQGHSKGTPSESTRQACQLKTVDAKQLDVIDTSDHQTAQSGVRKSIIGDLTVKVSAQLQQGSVEQKPLCSELGDAYPSVLLSNPKSRSLMTKANTWDFLT